MNINVIETKISNEMQGLGSAVLPFGWITRKGAFIQDYAIELGFKRIEDILDKYGQPIPRDELFDYWIRVEGMLITANCDSLTKTQIGALQEFLLEFPHLYRPIGSRVQFISDNYKFTHNINGLYVEER